MKKKILNKIRMMFVKHKIFIGVHIDIITERKKFVSDRDIIIIGEKWLRQDGHRKVHRQIIWYVENNALTRLMGFKYKKVHLANM